MSVHSSEYPTQRVAIYMPTLGGGGAERGMANLANGLCERGIETDLVLCRREGSYLADAHPDISIHALGGGRIIRSLLPLARYLKEREPDVLISALPSTIVVGRMALWLAGVSTAFIGSVQNTTGRIVEDPSTSWKKRFILEVFRRVLPTLDHVSGVSKGVARDTERFAGLSCVSVVHNPVVTEATLEKAEREVPHPWLSDEALDVILAVGRLHPQKNYPLLLDAVARLSTERPNVRLIILGTGEQEAEIRKRIVENGIEDRVCLHGYTDNPFAFYAHADVFALSSDWEGLPTVLIEAIACGCPPVSTDCPSGPEEILRGGAIGELVPVGDLDAFTAGLERTLDAQPDVEGLRRRGQEYGVDQVVDDYLSLLARP